MQIGASQIKLIYLLALFADALMVTIRTKNAAVARLGPQSGATPGTGVKNQSVIERNFKFLDKATLRTG
jgi:hypothetical protein